jgi:hypothetical protein
MIGCSSPGRVWEFFSSPLRPDRLWDPPSLLANEYQGLFSWGYSDRGVILTTHLHLVPRSRMCGATPPLPQNTSMAWCLVKAQRQLYLFFNFHLYWFTVWTGGEGKRVIRSSRTMHLMTIPVLFYGSECWTLTNNKPKEQK